MAQESHGDMLKALGQEQRLAVMKGNIGKCVDYLRVRPGAINEQILGDVIVGVLQNALIRGDHRYRVMHKQQEETLFPGWVTNGPYDCNKGEPAAAGAGAGAGAGKGGRRKMNTKKRKTRKTRHRSSRRGLRSNSRNHSGGSK
jgi:hypothetical protein